MYKRCTFICTKTYRPRRARESNGKRQECICSCKKEGKKKLAKRGVVGSEKRNNKMRTAQKEALDIARKTYGSTWSRPPINRMYLPVCARRCTHTRIYARDIAHTLPVTHTCVVHNASRLFDEQPRIYPLSSAVYTLTRAPDNTRWLFSRPHLFSILNALISRGELL